MIKSVATYLPNKTPLQAPTPEDEVVNYFSFLTLRRLESESQYKYNYKHRVKEEFDTWFRNITWAMEHVTVKEQRSSKKNMA